MTRQTLLSYWMTVACFFLLVVTVVVPPVGEYLRGMLLLVPWAVFCLMCVLLAVSAWRDRSATGGRTGRLRKWLIAMGLSGAGAFASAILHNLVYGLLIVLFGQDFWERTGLGDEPVFFILGALVLPLAFLVCAIVSAILLVRARRQPAGQPDRPA